MEPSETNEQLQVFDGSAADPAWKWLYYAGGAAAVAMVALFRRFFATELVAFNGFGLFDVPDTASFGAADWFVLLQENRLLGLVLFDLFDLINYVLLGVVFLALYGALRETNKGMILLATAFGFVGIAVYAASNQAFAMLSLSNSYTAAETEAGQAAFLAAGEELLALHNPGKLQQGTGIYLSFFLVLLAGLLISIVMMRSTRFNRAAAYAGVAANLLALGYFPALALGADIVWVFPTVSVPFRMIWYILIAVGLFRLAAHIKNKELDIIVDG